MRLPVLIRLDSEESRSTHVELPNGEFRELTEEEIVRKAAFFSRKKVLESQAALAAQGLEDLREEFKDLNSMFYDTAGGDWDIRRYPVTEDLSFL